MTDLTKRLSRRAALAGFCTLALAPSMARAEDYPARPVRIVVGFPPGAAGDLAGRVVAAALSRALGQQFIIDNRPGASSSIAADYAARAPKDGYTLYFSTVANVVSAAVSSNQTFDLARDFEPIGLAGIAPVILVAHPSLGVRNLPELVALARKKPDELFYASTGVATSLHLVGALLNAQAGIRLTHVPYQGSPQAVTDLVAGRTQLMFASASTVMPHIASGALVPLAWATAERSSLKPDLPTAAEEGVAGIAAGIWFGLMAPKGTPAAIVDKLAGSLTAAMESEAVQSQFKLQSFDPLRGGPAEFSRFIAAEQTKWNEAAKLAGLRK